MKRALILVDIQNDFLPGGALAVAQGDEIVQVANATQSQHDLIVATQDWHPPQHQSFASNHQGREVGEVIDLHGLSQVLWPAHCVQHTGGAFFAPGLETARIERVFPKGTDPTVDSYSGFFDNGHKKATGLGDYLKDRGVGQVELLGLATDYCVKFTALDAVALGFDTVLIEDGCRGVELSPGNVQEALKDLRLAGVTIRQSGQL